MTQLLVRDLPEETVAGLRRMAAQHGRSVAEELREILNAAARAGQAFALPEPLDLKGRKARKSLSEVLLEGRR